MSRMMTYVVPTPPKPPRNDTALKKALKRSGALNRRDRRAAAALERKQAKAASL